MTVDNFFEIFRKANNKADLQKISALTDVNGVVRTAAAMRTTGAGSPFFSFFVGQDRKEGLEIDRKSFFKNLRNSGSWAYQDMINQLGKPVYKTRWGMTTPTVNAYIIW